MPKPDSVLVGVFPVLATPFREDDSIDPSGLRRIVDLVVAAGAHGVVYPGNASEYETLNESERNELVDTVFSAVHGRVPVIVGLSATEPEISVSHARQARKLGALAVMLMPPSHLKGDIEAIGRLYEDVAQAVSAPIILQNAPPPFGPALSVDVVLSLVSANPRIAYVKEETLPSGQRISHLKNHAPSHLKGLFGGAGGRYIMGEMARGITGSMPSCECTEIHVAIYDAYARGDAKEARRIFNRLVPLLNFAGVFRSSAVKEVLRERGVLECAARRSSKNPELDNDDRKELAAILADMNDMWRGSAASGAAE